MPNLQAKIVYIDPIKQPTEKFSVRAVGLKTEDEVNGSVYENFLGMQAANQVGERMDEFQPEDIVEVTYSPRGQCKKNDKIDPSEKNPDCLSIFTNLNITNIVLIERKSAQPAGSPAPAANQGQAAPPVTGGSDDLPF